MDDVESGGLSESEGAGSKSPGSLGKLQGSRGNAWKHYAGLRPLLAPSSPKEKQAEVVLEPSPELVKSHPQLPSEAFEPASELKETSFWEKVRASFSYHHEQFNWLDPLRVVARVKETPPSGPPPAVAKSQCDEVYKGSKASDVSNTGEERRKEATLSGFSNSLKLLLQRASDKRPRLNVNKEAFGLTNKNQAQTQHRKSTPARTKGKPQIHSSTIVDNSGNSEALAGSSGSEMTSRFHEHIARWSDHAPPKRIFRHHDDNASPEDAPRPIVSALFPRQPMFDPVEAYTNTAPEEPSTMADHTHPAYTMSLQAQNPLDPRDIESIPAALTKAHYNSSANPNGFDCGERGEAHEQRLSVMQQFRSQQQNQCPGLALYPEMFPALEAVSEATEGSLRSEVRSDHQELVVIHSPGRRHTVTDKADAGPSVNDPGPRRNSAALANDADHKSLTTPRWPLLDPSNGCERCTVTISQASRNSQGTTNTDACDRVPQQKVAAAKVGVKNCNGIQSDGKDGNRHGDCEPPGTWI